MSAITTVDAVRAMKDASRPAMRHQHEERDSQCRCRGMTMAPSTCRYLTRKYRFIASFGRTLMTVAFKTRIEFALRRFFYTTFGLRQPSGPSLPYAASHPEIDASAAIAERIRQLFSTSAGEKITVIGQATSQGHRHPAPPFAEFPRRPEISECGAQI